jgi:hypothetical protein
LLFLLLLFQQFVFELQAQSLRDNIWIIGNIGGGTTIDFSGNPVTATYVATSMTHLSTNASICDSLGNLLFYTNGNYIASASHQPMWNGLNLDLGFLGISPAPNAPQIIMALPLPNSSNMYYLFYKALIEVTPDSLTSKFYYSTIDMDKNQGKGMVIDKNHLVLEGTYLDWGEMTSCRHANGRDWWILLGESDSNKYYRYLFTPEGLLEHEPQVIGVAVPSGLGQAVFSPDGTKYARLNIVSTEIGTYMDIYNFDRCTGLLSNHLQFMYSDGAGAGGLAFSPNSRYLYASSQNHVYQYDTSIDDIESTNEVVAVYDGFESPFWTTFYQAQLAPDGKIYICASNGADVLHVVNSPDEKGLGCEFMQHSFYLPTSNWASMPNFPYFNLGALPGSPCDTLGVSAAKEEGQRGRVEVSPNPASEYVVISLPQYIKDAIFTLHSTTGQLVFTQQLAEGQESMVGLEGIAPGLYFYEVKDNEKLLGSGKLVRVE